MRQLLGLKFSLVSFVLFSTCAFPAERSCTEILNVADVPIFIYDGNDSLSPFFFVSHFMIDADGAPTAYHPDDIGLDALRHAGRPGHWWALVTDDDGEPVIQKDDDPAPGFYVSTTALDDSAVEDIRSPRRYVDAGRVPYISLPPQALEHARLGDVAFVLNLENGRSAGAIIADVGPRDLIGEGSIALAQALGINPDARRGGSDGRIAYIVFPGTGDRRPIPTEEIEHRTRLRLANLGGTSSLPDCSGEAESD